MKSTRRIPAKPARRVYDVVTFGAATRDIFALSSEFEKRIDPRAPDGFDACLPLGAKIEVERMAFETGGGATNAGATFAQWGFKTACVTRVGDDPGGREIERQLKTLKIATKFLQYDKEVGTAYSIILVAGQGQRAILTARGASKRIEAARVPWKELDAAWYYVTNVGGNLALLKKIFQTAKAQLTHIAWNPGGVEIALGLKALLPQLMQTDVLVLNREEASALAQTSYRHLDAIIRKLAHLPRVVLVITDGAKGAYAAARGVVWHVTPPKTKVLNTTGAGDAFGSGFAAALMKNPDLEVALKAGALNALGVIGKMGPKAGLLRAFPPKKDLARAKIREIEI